MANNQRQYENFTLFNCRMVDMRHLWVPSDTYKGQKQQKPNYFGNVIVQKTQPRWDIEPGLAGLVQALGKLHANNPQIQDWRIMDGDMPNPETGKISDFARGHWVISGSSGNPIKVELVQAGGQLVTLQNKVGVKSGDYCMIGGAVAVSGQNNRAAKVYLNNVVFTAPGEEIVFANQVSGAELMEMARAQGLNPAGFSAAPGGFTPGGGAPNFGGGGFNPNPAPSFGQPQPAPNFGGGAPGGFNPSHGGSPSAPVPGNGQPAFGGAPGHGGTVGNGNATFPSNGGGQFSPPQGPNFGPGVQQQTPNFAPNFGR